MKGNLKMKRLNNKGFTLIELLAVIVILAIVVAITIPAVLSSINGARSSAFNTTAKTVADWAEREYQAYMVSDETVQKVDTSFKTLCSGLKLDGTEKECYNGTVSTATGSVTTNINDFLNAAGVDPKNYSNAYIKVLNNGRVCVQLTANGDGDYKNESGNVAKSPACP